MSEGNEGARPPTAFDPPPGGGLVYWMLLLMGVATLASCVILPEWRTYQALRLAQQAEQHRLDTLKAAVDRERRVFEALQGNPAVIDRLAQRDLRYRRLGQRVVRVGMPADDDAEIVSAVTGLAGDESFLPQPVPPPELVARALGRLPDYDYDAVFCDDETRPMLMAMSVALIGAAVGLFGWRRTPSANG